MPSNGALGGGDGIFGVAALELQAARILFVTLAHAHLRLGIGAGDLGQRVVVIETNEQVARLRAVVEAGGDIDDAAGNLGGDAHFAALGLHAAGGRGSPRRLDGGEVVLQLRAVGGARVVCLRGLLFGDRAPADAVDVEADGDRQKAGDTERNDRGIDLKHGPSVSL